MTLGKYGNQSASETDDSLRSKLTLILSSLFYKNFLLYEVKNNPFESLFQYLIDSTPFFFCLSTYFNCMYKMEYFDSPFEQIKVSEMNVCTCYLKSRRK